MLDCIGNLWVAAPLRCSSDAQLDDKPGNGGDGDPVGKYPGHLHDIYTSTPQASYNNALNVTPTPY